MAGSLAYYTQAVARTQRELEKNAEPEPEPEPEPEARAGAGARFSGGRTPGQAGAGCPLQLARRLERLAQQQRDLGQREQAMPVTWHDERVAEAARRFEEAAKPWPVEIFGAYDVAGDSMLSQSEYRSSRASERGGNAGTRTISGLRCGRLSAPTCERHRECRIQEVSTALASSPIRRRA